ncbi:MAG: hypothetical protein WKF30_18265 [Pyrinomonadaceae bacterium]
MAVSVMSRTDGGAEVEVSLEKTGAGKGIIRVRSWKAASVPASSRPHRDETYQLYDIETSADGAMTTCRASAPGSDPAVTISIDPVGANIMIDVKGTSFRLGDGRTTYQINGEAQKSIQDFLVASFRA